jgi:LuxR family transcriptional regulator
MTILEYLHFVSGAKSLEELWHAHVVKMAEYGFDRLIYGYTRFKTETSLGDPDDFVILTNHDQKYISGFLHQGLYRQAPMVLWALENEGACSWKIIRELLNNGQLGPASKQVIEFNERMQLTAGYTISFFSASKRYKGAISLAAKPGSCQSELDEMWKEHGEDIVLMNNVVHLKILTLPYDPPNRSLTNRQREALEWVGDGKTTQDIALLMGLTSATVEKHLRLARASLSVEAALQNQMYILET